MKRLALSAALLVGLVLAGCGGGDTIDGPECVSNDDCVEGYLCITEKCQLRDAVQIETESLPDATADASYSTVVAASGGQEPYQWSLIEKPGWMSIEPDTGHIRGTPGEPATGVEITVRVQDATSGRDSSDEKTFTIDVASCAEGETVVCTEVQDDKCMIGRKTCHNGQFSACSNLDFSIDFDQCGPQCGPCEENRADSCKVGTCACGDGGACTAPDICCSGGCIDGNSDGNCGACGRVCAVDMANTVNPRCQDGSCISDGCLPGWLDCDGDSQNGCETAESTTDCGACGADCSAVAHVEEVVCELSEDGSSCGYNGDGSVGLGCELGWYDCDGDRTNGCETPVDGGNCGGCGLACSSQCLLHPDGDRYYCGCTGDGDCGTGGLCCNGECALDSDPRHCGSCANDCTAQVQHAAATCADGQCGHGQCDSGWLDCDGNAANGCELAMDDDNCGSCGFACGANASCDTSSGTCACVDNYGNCLDGWTDGCETDLTSTPAHCGSCDHDCADDLQHVTEPLCNGGSCDFAACQSGWDNCDDNRSNGCEQDIWQTTACGNDCNSLLNCEDEIQNASGTNCNAGNCDYTACLSSYDDCDGNRGNGCEEGIWETNDCGTNCNNRVDCNQQIQHASGTTCDSGLCDYGNCDQGYDDCNANRQDGCEQYIWATNNCGSNCNDTKDCNQEVQNVMNPSCNQGLCDYDQCSWCAIPGSGPGFCFSDCNGNRSDGCEYNLWQVDDCRHNCSDVGDDCTTDVLNASGVRCVGSCDYETCNNGFGDCDTNKANGCEINLQSDKDHCGGCNYDCDDHVDNASGIYCSTGLCNYQSCWNNYGDCDSNRQNGCEQSFRLVDACGNSCGTLKDCTQTVQHATGILCNTSGSCDYSSCESNHWGDCNNNRADGCETDLWVDGNCGSCGHTCPSGWICIGGTCTNPN